MDVTALALKSSLSGFLALVVAALGGADSILDLLIALIVCDIATGLLNAFIRKELSSTAMRSGFVHKILIFVLIVIAVKLDIVIVDCLSKDFHVRTFVIAFFCLEELLSVLENSANAGVPIPTWLRNALKKVSNEVNTTTPRFITKFAKEKFNINLSGGDNDENSELKDEASSSDDSSDSDVENNESDTETSQNN